MNSIKYFIPADFSEASYKAIQYASLLAEKTGGVIHLGHVIDADEIIESDNPVIVRWNLDRLEKKTVAKMQSLKEIISGNGIPVSSEIVFGRLKSGVLKMIARFTPDVIVLPRRATGAAKSELLTYLSKHCRQPFLVVPECFVPHVPEHAVVATDLRPANGELHTFFQLISKTANEVSLLNIRSLGAPKEPVKHEWITLLEAKYRLGTKLLQYENNNVVRGVINFVRTNPVDLLCTIKRNKNFLKRALSDGVSNEIASQAEVPVLVIRE